MRALVTGGTKGIGLAIVRMLLSQGYTVTATYARDSVTANVLQHELSTKGFSIEVVKAAQDDKKQMTELVKHIRANGPIDCIVCNAGITDRSRLSEISDESWERVMQVNVNSNMSLIRDLYPDIAPKARIVFISSVMGILPHSMSLAYGVSKAAVIALAKNLVKEFAGSGTTVNVIAPGFVETDWQKEKPEYIRQNICNKTAAGRFALPEEIAEAVCFCLKNEFVNGSVIEISGGYCYK